MRPVRYFAAVGDVHGHMNAMVRDLKRMESKRKLSLDLVLQVGDFEPHRDEDDLRSMVAPSKYKQLGDFAEYRSNRCRFPWPLHFIGGNHEPHLLLEQFPNGGEVAPRCHYWGRVAVRDLSTNLRVLGLSGIHEEEAYARPRPPAASLPFTSHAFVPFNEADVESALDAGRVDVLLLHEWPARLPGAQDAVTRRKLQVGNEPARLLVDLLRPKLVLCGHMHSSFRVELVHDSGDVSRICCLADVASGAEGFALFEVTPEGPRELR
jgi:hypothetical protein